jgi:hypothetical protein
MRKSAEWQIATFSGFILMYNDMLYFFVFRIIKMPQKHRIFAYLVLVVASVTLTKGKRYPQNIL